MRRLPSFSRVFATLPCCLQRTPPLLLAVVIGGVLGGCDAVDVRSHNPAEESKTVHAQVESPSFTQADLLFEPVSIPSGGAFTIELIDDERDQSVAEITHKQTEAGTKSLRANFKPLQAQSVTVECRNQDAKSQTKTTSLSSKLSSADGQTIGTTNAEPSSYHYVDNGETVIVEVDYAQLELDEPSAPPEQAPIHFRSPDRSVECTYVTFTLQGVSESISADGIRFRGGSPTFVKKEIR